MKTARLLLVIPFPDQSLHLAQIQALAACLKELGNRRGTDPSGIAAAFEVDAIRRDDFAAFIARRFAAGNRKISEETAARLISFGHTFRLLGSAQR